MLHKFLCTLFFLLFFSFGNVAVAQKIKAQLIGGITASQINGDGDSGFRKLGFTGGFGAFIPIKNKFSFSFEGLYSSRGASSALKCSDSTCIDGFKFKINTTYVEVPILLNYRDKSNVSFGAGVSIGRLIRYSYQENGYATIEPRDLDLENNNMDYSALAEGSYRMFDNVWINLRYQYSIVPFAKNKFSRYNRFGAFHNSVGIRIKYIFKSVDNRGRIAPETQP